MNIRITSDSTCDLNPEYLRAHRVEIGTLSIKCNTKKTIPQESGTPDIYAVSG